MQATPLATTLVLTGRVTTHSAARLVLTVSPRNLAARIKTTSTGQSAQLGPLPVLSGRIRTSAAARIAAFGLGSFLSGRIVVTSQAQIVAASLVPQLRLAARLASTSAARRQSQVSGTISLSGQIKTVGALQGWSDRQVPLGISFLWPARIKTTVRLQGTAQPLFALTRGGRITTMVSAQLLRSELLEPLPAYPLPFPVQPLDHWLGLITSEHKPRPKYVKTVSLSVDPVVADTTLAATLPGLFDLDYSHGEQEDFTGQWIGKSRWIELPNPFFSWDFEGMGWNQANWKGPFDSQNALQRLDDYHYRLLLYATVIANHWDGSVPAAYAAWDTLFHWTGLKVVIQDYGNMTMMYGLLWETAPDTVLLSLFTSGQMDLKPEGIALISYIFQTEPGVPLFAWDAETSSVAGWDEGAWGTLVPPGLGISPIILGE